MKFKEILIYRPPLRRQDLNVISGTGGLSFFSTKITLRSQVSSIKKSRRYIGNFNSRYYQDVADNFNYQIQQTEKF